MPTNPFFNFNKADSEQTLVEDLVVEAIQIYGRSCFYIPRDAVDMDRLFGEDELAKYSNAQEIELYVKTSVQLGGQGFLLSKFGMHEEEQITFLVAQRRFHQTFSQSRPREGDVIYLPFSDPAYRYMFEVRYVNATEQLFQLGKLYTYELKCESMNYTHERVQTTNPDINRVAEREAYTIPITMASGSGTFQYGEMVYQGGSFLSATVTAMVAVWNVSTKLLSVQNVVGAFSDGPVLGVTSGAVWTPVTTPSTSPKNLEPTTLDSSDHDLLDLESPGIVETPSNPRFNK